MNFIFITLFPEVVETYMNASILGRALKGKKIKVDCINPRDFTSDKHHKTDEKAYGGGPGMVMKAEPVLKAVKKAKGRKKNVKVVLFSPSGKQFDQKEGTQFSKKYRTFIFVCGRYEGIDGRVKKILRAQEYTVGPYTLTGGELPAMTMADAVARQIPGVLGNENSVEESRVASPEVYTRPESFKWREKNYHVPRVLLSGNHKDIDNWREKKKRT